MFISTGCTIEEGGERQPETLGLMLWNIARNDVGRVNSVLMQLSRYYYLIQIEDEAERESYAEQYFSDAAIVVEGNRHTLIYNTYYNTTYSLIIDTFGDRWQVRRTGGRGYTATLIYKGDNYFDITFDSIHNDESTGNATLSGNIRYNDDKGTPEIFYDGTITMVDSEASTTKPLTITIDIVYPIRYTSPDGLLDGIMKITAYDAIYNTTDVATASIVPYEHRVIIDSMGTLVSYGSDYFF